MQIAHSAFPDSPLGPDAFNEYELLLVQDYEELVKKLMTEVGQPEGSKLETNLTSEDEGWSQLTSGEDDSPHPEATPSRRYFYKDNLIGNTEDVGQRLAVSVHHFPMIFCPFSPRIFVLPSEGSIAEASLSIEHEDAFSPGLPSLSTGLPFDGDDTPPGVILTASFLYHLAAQVTSTMHDLNLNKCPFFLYFFLLPL